MTRPLSIPPSPSTSPDALIASLRQRIQVLEGRVASLSWLVIVLGIALIVAVATGH